MDTDKIVVSLYPRNNWQAFDLGTRLVSLWWKQLYGFWFLITFPLFLICIAISPEYGLLILWWLKPLFEVGLLHILSRNIFQQSMGVRETLRVFLKLIKPIIIPALTWRRLSLNRGFNLAVSQLEGLTGERRKNRLNVLHRRTEGIHWWLIVCVHLETFSIAGLLTLVMIMTPESSSFNFIDYIAEGSTLSLLITNFVAYLCMWFIAPLFQAGSFMAYLNRRIILEGWDIELQLKGIAKKLKSASKAFATLLMFAFSSLLFINEPVYASVQVSEQSNSEVFTEEEVQKITIDTGADENAEKAETQQWVENSKEKLQTIISEDPFVEESTSYDWEWVGWRGESNDDKKSEPNDYSFLASIVQIIAKFAEFIFWGLFIVLVVSVLWLTRHHIVRLFSEKPREPIKKQIIPDFIAHESVPHPQNNEDYSVAIEHAIKTGQWRACMSLMLVTSIQVIQQEYPIELHKSNTEKECLKKIWEQVPEQEFAYFNELFDTWITVAWSQNSLEPEQFDALYERWKLHIAGKLVAV